MKKMDALFSDTGAQEVPNRVLIFSPSAANDLLNHKIGWGRHDFQRNRREQGGWMIGHHTRNQAGEIITTEVDYVLEAETSIREPGYIEWSALEDIRLQRAFFAIQQECAERDPAFAKGLELVGWWHTHPNRLPVFLSGTDMTTIREKFNQPGHYSVVLNPHTMIWRAFSGVHADEVHGLMMLSGATKKKPDKKKKQKKTNWNKKKRKTQANHLRRQHKR